ncbi:MAG: helix-turn-helix domain-containing protein [Planctomycetaceae bacterium]|jgi:transcriptional regulator with XRE-family HTH domain|nr:helix-turn-helix domain-containing protein [Planctomycetaceae bacterium]
MFTPTFDEQWLSKKFAEVDDSFINAGGLRTEKLKNKMNEEDFSTVHYSQRKAFAKLVELSRRRRNMSQIELAEKIGTAIEEIVEIEDGTANSVEPSTIYALAQEFNIPCQSLMILTGLATSKNPTLTDASIRFAACSKISAPLQQDEESILNTFVQTLVAAK